MGKTALRVLSTFLAGLGAVLVTAAVDFIRHTAEGPAPDNIPLPVWGLIVWGLAALGNWLVKRFGPQAPAEPTEPPVASVGRRG